jgi:hypothetical protein
MAVVMAFALVGGSPQKASADLPDDANICEIDGFRQIAQNFGGTAISSPVFEGSVFAYIARIEDDSDADDPDFGDHEYMASIDDTSGKSRLVGYLDPDPDGSATTSDIIEHSPTKVLNNLDLGEPEDTSTGLDDELIELNATNADQDILDDGDDPIPNDVCGNGADDPYVGVFVACYDAGDFDLTIAREDAGGGQDEEDSMSIEVRCFGPVTSINLTAQPARVQIVPSLGDVAHSLITASLLDEDSQQTFAGSGDVDFSVDHGCVLGGLATEEQLGEFVPGPGSPAEDYTANQFAFSRPFPSNFPENAGEIENAYQGPHTTGNGYFPPLSPSFTANQVGIVDLNGPVPGGNAVVAATILHCDEPGATPGTATVTARLHIPGPAPDVIKTVTVTVVGPPTNVVVSVDNASPQCGSRVTVTVKVTDAVGQNVSDHTPVEVISNLGSVLGGTGAVADQDGLVTPISSTVAETFSGIATFFLLTSDTQESRYELVATSGGGGWPNFGGVAGGDVTFDHVGELGGWFSTPTVSGFATVDCKAAAAPAVSAPSTGTGPLRAPNTGDAGLADSSSSSWMLLGLAAAVAFALSGIAAVKVARR